MVWGLFHPMRSRRMDPNPGEFPSHFTMSCKSLGPSALKLTMRLTFSIALPALSNLTIGGPAESDRSRGKSSPLMLGNQPGSMDSCITSSVIDCCWRRMRDMKIFLGENEWMTRRFKLRCLVYRVRGRLQEYELWTLEESKV